MYARTDSLTAQIGGIAAEWPLAHHPRAARRAREITAAILRRWGVGEETTEAALVVVSELVTNSVVHARPPLALHLIRDRARRQLRVEVADGGPGRHEGEPVACRTPDEHGRGLVIVDAVSTAHGVRAHAHGAVHWASLPNAV